MAFTFATSGAIVFKAGKNVDANIANSGAYLVQLSDESEALINATAKIDLTAVYSSLSANIKKILQDISSSYGAMALIEYDMAGYTSRPEAEIMLDILNDRVNRGLELIKDNNTKITLGAV